MSKKTKVSGSVKEMEIAYKGSANPHDHKRLMALQMAQQGVWVLVDIGRALSKGRATKRPCHYRTMAEIIPRRCYGRDVRAWTWWT